MVIKAAKELNCGDTILVNLGMGKAERIVDRVVYDPATKAVKITLYASVGRRPQIVLPEDRQLETNRVAERCLTAGAVDGRVKMYALVTDQGTAAHETALCEKCYLDPANQGYARELASRCDDIPDLHTFHDCSGNDALNCCICGQNIYGETEEEEE